MSNDVGLDITCMQRYWGTEEGWQVHRDGLQRMIEVKGGVHELHDDWRLELVVGLYVAEFLCPG